MTSHTSHAGDTAKPDETADELRLWADYYDASARALEMVPTGDITGEMLLKIVAEDRGSDDAIDRSSEVRRVKA
jgi:hypothetical protein